MLVNLKGSIIILSISLLLLGFAYQTNTEQTKQKHITWRNGNLGSISFEEMVKQADIIAVVEIKGIMEIYEYEHDSLTKFQAIVRKYYKNDTSNNDSITFYQVGSPSIQYRQNPLLEENKNYILFLQEVDSAEHGDDFGRVLLMIQEGYGRYNFIDSDYVQRQMPINSSREKIPFIWFEQQLLEEMAK